jgi:hypothetical protein
MCKWIRRTSIGITSLSKGFWISSGRIVKMLKITLKFSLRRYSSKILEILNPRMRRSCHILYSTRREVLLGKEAACRFRIIST